MVEETDFLFDTSGSTSACHERKQPRHYLIFSSGSPIAPEQLYKREQRCIRHTVNTRLFWRPHPNTHYWYTRDMEWWFSAAKQVLDDLHQLLMRQSSVDKYLLYKASLCGPWRCGPWKSHSTWLSRFIHYYYAASGTILQPFRNRVDKHLRDSPDTLRFDIFLLQCWSEMALDPAQQRTFDTIYYINDESPEIGMVTINKYMDRIGPNAGQGEQPEEPGANDHWGAPPAEDSDFWRRLHPALTPMHHAMFEDYARHLTIEFQLDLQTARVLTRSCPPECFSSYVTRRDNFINNRLVSYMDYVTMLAQRELETVAGTPSLSPGPSTAASLAGPATPTDEVNSDSLLDSP